MVFRPPSLSISTKPCACSSVRAGGRDSAGVLGIWAFSCSSVTGLVPMPFSFHMAKRTASWGSDRPFGEGMVAPYSLSGDISVSDMILQCLPEGTLIYQPPCLLTRTYMPADEATAFMDVLSKSPQFKVLTILTQRPQEELTKTEIAQKAGIGRTTLYRVWDDLEKMKAISPSRHVGAVTLYRMNAESPVVQSFLNITKSLTTVTDAVARIEQLRKLQDSARTEFGDAPPPGPSVLVKLLRANAISPEVAASRAELGLTSAEAEGLKGLVTAGLVFEESGKFYLTQLGNQTAQGAAKIWSIESSQSVDQAISTAKVALNLINQEIRRLKGQVK